MRYFNWVTNLSVQTRSLLVGASVWGMRARWIGSGTEISFRATRIFSESEEHQQSSQTYRKHMVWLRRPTRDESQELTRRRIFRKPVPTELDFDKEILLPYTHRHGALVAYRFELLRVETSGVDYFGDVLYSTQEDKIKDCLKGKRSYCEEYEHISQKSLRKKVIHTISVVEPQSRSWSGFDASWKFPLSSKEFPLSSHFRRQTKTKQNYFR